MITARQIFGFIGASSISLISFALFLQYLHNIEPCPMCIIQRYTFSLIGVIALIAFFHNPSRLGIKLYSLLITVFSLLGAGVAMRHVYLEIFPPEMFDCGADLGYLIDAFPLTQMLPMIFRGTGDCSEVLWTFMGLSIAGWALLWFFVFTGLTIFTLIVKKDNSVK